ncbi:MAG: RNA polymerase sigma factor (sigma-70 family) [Saprospiraceae bacterium]
MDKTLNINQLFFTKTQDWKKTLYNDHASVLMGVAIRYCKNRSVAEDVLHDSFVQIYEGIDRFKNQGSIQGWMRKIVVVNSIKHFKKNDIFQNDNSLHELIDESSVEEVDPVYSKRQLQQALGSLSDGYRTVFNMYVIDGLPHTEISSLLGISEGTSRSQYLRARKSLREKLRAYER